MCKRPSGAAAPACWAGIVLTVTVMDEKDFKKHLRDLVHGHHHPQEHDWSPDTNVRKTSKSAGTNLGKPAKGVVRKVKRRAK